jgi:hypothetical protein
VLEAGATGGSSAADAASTDAATPPAGDAATGGEMDSNVAIDGYVVAEPWKGYGFTATDPGAATITPDCTGGAACTPPFAGAAFCMKGTVTGKADFSGFAMLGWNVNQDNNAEAGTPADWLVPASGGLTITVANPGKTQLRVQLQGADPHSAADRWCATLTSGKQILWTSFKTNCWTGGTPQTPLAAGTVIQQAAITVPGTQKDLPFDVCLVDIKIE